jgi:hypothetical protein
MCMACPHQALISLDMPAATNARVNGAVLSFCAHMCVPFEA